MHQKGPNRSPKEILEELRLLQEQAPEARDRLSLLHELSVYQEELVVQNEALTHSQAVLEQTRDRFIELYDFAPTAYVTLDSNGVIRESNLTAASLLGKSKPALEGLPFVGFVLPGARRYYFDFLRRCRDGQQTNVETELSVLAGNGVRYIQLQCRVRSGGDGSSEYFTAIIDVTEQRQIERERSQIVRERVALAGRLIAAQDDERLRIARNLHDDLGQQVTALRLRLEELASGVSGGKTSAPVARIQEMVHHLDQRLHFVASELRPATLDLGVVAALDQFVREWSTSFGVPAAFHSTGIKIGTLTPHVETHLYRIAQEALNNVAKYASASQVTVLLEGREDGVVLVVEDDGRGFDLETNRRGGNGLGLVGMRERAQIFNGRFEVESVPGNGTSIYVHVPHRGSR